MIRTWITSELSDVQASGPRRCNVTVEVGTVVCWRDFFSPAVRCTRTLNEGLNCEGDKNVHYRKTFGRIDLLNHTLLLVSAGRFIGRGRFRSKALHFLNIYSRAGARRAWICYMVLMYHKVLASGPATVLNNDGDGDNGGEGRRQPNFYD